MQKRQTPLSVGAVIHRHYIVEGLPGKGDFCNVYLVRDRRDKQKLFALAEIINPVEQERYGFSLEYVSLAPLDRQALPRVQYAFNDDKQGRAYLLMSYIDGLNLEMLRLQQAEKRFPLAEVTMTMTPVVNAIVYLHNRRPPVIHRNIQPTNIFIAQTIDEPALAMLDIFREHGSTTTTLDYFAPGYGATEQYKGEFSIRTDIYGLGATYYTLLTGIVPPDALYRSTQLNNGEIDPLKPVNEAIPGIPLVIAEAIQQAMSINVDDRFSSVEQFREVLVSPANQAAPELSDSLPSTSPSPPAIASNQPDSLQPGELDG
ncbi:MAG: serine/threonine protein kinase, partial [Ktedonobacteraceae bacterium]